MTEANVARLRFPALTALLLLALVGPRPSPVHSLSLPAVAWRTPAAAQALSGRAVVTDGDTLRIGGTKIRLFGVDAPESHQQCRDIAGRDWPCGAVATERLKRLVAERRVVCDPQNTDRYGRTVASCSVDGRDLGAAIVAEGLGRAYARYSDRYLGDEAAARAARRGLWQAESEAPWDWRKTRSQARSVAAAAAIPKAPAPDTTATVAAADGCSIKGNISSDGRRLYHTQAMASWSRTRIDPDRGERLFCDEAAARAAGWLPAAGSAR